MALKRIFIMIAAVALTSAAVADNAIVASKKYVDDFIAEYQNKVPGAGTDKLMIYDESPDGIGEKDIVSSLGENTSAADVPNVGAVKAGMDGKQDTINGTAGYVMTGTGNAGDVGERAIYGTNTNYANALVTAETVNTGVINAVNSSLIQVNESGSQDQNGTLWEISDSLVALSTRLLPVGYTQLEWIQSDGTQYINTGIKSTSSTFFTLEVMFASRGSGYRFFGNGGDGVSAGFSASSNKLFINSTSNAAVETFGLFNKKAIITYAGTNVNINGTDYTCPQAKAKNTNIYINARADSLNTRVGAGKWFRVKIGNSSGLQGDFIPASKVENDVTVVGMYDMVSGEFFRDAAGGNFIAGPSVAN